MFFMGGMTLGYLHPPAPKLADGNANASGEEKSPRSSGPSPANSHDGAIERTLLWARRILC